MQAVLAPTALIHSRTALATNSGPLSDLMCAGTPRAMNRSDRTSITSMAFSLRAIRIFEDVEHAILSPVVGAVFDEVVGPHVIAMLWSQADARAVRQP